MTTRDCTLRCVDRVTEEVPSTVESLRSQNLQTCRTSLELPLLRPHPQARDAQLACDGFVRLYGFLVEHLL